MPNDSEFDRLRTEMNGAWEAKECAKQEQDRAWDDVQSAQSRYGHRIEQLTRDHGRAFEDMKAAFTDASSASSSGDHKGGRPVFSKGP